MSLLPTDLATAAHASKTQALWNEAKTGEWTRNSAGAVVFRPLPATEVGLELNYDANSLFGHFS